jgi:hypothetical protein
MYAFQTEKQGVVDLGRKHCQVTAFWTSIGGGRLFITGKTFGCIPLAM